MPDTSGDEHAKHFHLQSFGSSTFAEIELSSFGWGIVEIDGRSLLSVSYDDASRTLFYELDKDGHLAEHLDVTGDAGWIRVR